MLNYRFGLGERPVRRRDLVVSAVAARYRRGPESGVEAMR
jgi:hypothetical protein